MVLRRNIIFGILSIIFLQISSISSTQYGSLSFVIDDTASMRTEIQKVKEATTTIYEAITQNSSQIQEVVVVTFNDPETKTQLRLKDQTKSAEKLRTTLGNIWVHGGGDCPEYSMSGIQVTLLNSLHNSYLFVFTDASPKDHKNKDKVINLAQARGSQVFFFLTTSADCAGYDPEYLFQPYYDIAKATNGQVFKLVSKEQVAKILKFLTLIVSGEGDVIKLPEIKPNKYEKIPFTVDDQTEYIVISASGTDLYLAITAGPTQNYEKIAWENDVKILKIVNPLPGSYEATVKGSSATTVMIFGRTDFTFQHGFAENIQPTFRDDVKQPTDGTKHHLLVKVADPSSSVIIKSAQILSMDEKVLLDLPLEKISKDYYKTDLFMPPRNPTIFKIKVIGEGKKTGKTITRTAKTPVEARLRSLDPEIEITGEGTYKFNSKVTLKCNVKASPKPTVTWKNETSFVISGTTTETLNPYEYTSKLTVDATKTTAYSCYAINDLGEKSKWVDIKVESPFIVEDKESDTVYANYGKSALLTCNIKSNYAMQIDWYLAKDGRMVNIRDTKDWTISNNGRELRINKVNKEAQYFCVATVPPAVTHTLDRTIKLNHQAPKMSEPEEKDVKENESFTMECKILEAFPKPKIQWQFKRHGAEAFQTLTSATETQETYTVNKADLSRDGVYRCVAENEKGKSHHDIKVVVKTKPKVSLLKDGREVNKIELDYAADISLACRVIAQPAPHIVWRDGKHNDILSNPAVIKDYEHTSYLKVSQAKRPETYTCTAMNLLGEESKVVQVEVKSPFEFVTKNGLINGKYGKDTILKCGVQTKVPARIIWMFRGTNITNSEKYSISAHGNQLTINALDIDSQGEYTCVIVITGDEVLQTSHKTEVRIIDIERPTLQKETTIVKVPRNKNVVLKCNVLKGKPKPIITWQVKSRKYSIFTSLNVTTENLEINAATDQDAGFYKCVAKNVIGQDEHSIELAVQGPPIILSNEDIVYRAVEGDPTLKIPCEVVGHPKPRIYWSTDKGNILAGGKFEIVENALIINNPKEEDSKEYICKAVNEFGETTKTFEGSVTKYFPDEELGDPTYIYIERGDTRDLKCNNGSLQGRWFKEWNATNTIGTLTLKKAEDNDSGNYTCRISDRLGSISRTYVVLVGYRPYFEVPNYVEVWTGKTTNLSCHPHMQPSQETAKVEWFYNGKPSDMMSGSPAQSKHPIIGWGTYICKVTNTHGTASKTLQVNSEDCLLQLSPEVKNTPLVLNPATGKWPNVKLDGNYWIVKSDQSLLLSCHHGIDSNKFQNLPDKYEILATCDHEDYFTVEGKKYRFTELQCQSQVLPTVKHTGKKCVSDKSEEINVGYHIDHSNEYLQVYSVCYDWDKNVPIYSRVELSSALNVIPALESWQKYEKFDENVSMNCDGKAECCLGSTQLTNQLEVIHGAPQIATFIKGLNTIPLWRNCNNSSVSWNKFENFLTSRTRGVIWSGASTWAKSDRVSVPRYLWKMYKPTPASKKPIIVVTVNSDHPKDADILCKSPCNHKVAEIIKDTFTFCCDLTEFREKFQLNL